MVAAYTIPVALLAPFKGALVDTMGPQKTLVPLSLLFALGLTLEAALGATSTLSRFVPAAVAGAAAPPLIATVRAELSNKLDGRDRVPAYASLALTADLCFVLSPLAVATLTLLASPALALAMAAWPLVLGALITILETAPAPRVPDEGWQPLASLNSGLRTLVVGAVALGWAFGALEVGLPAATEDDGPGYGGILLAAFATGSVLGGLWYGARRPTRPADVEYIQVLAALPVLLFPVAIIVHPVAIAFNLAVAGLLFAPLNTLLYRLLDQVAPAHAPVESFAWLTSAQMVGGALGAAAAGLLAEGIGAGAALSTGSLVLAAAALFTLAQRHWLRDSSQAEAIS